MVVDFFEQLRPGVLFLLDAVTAWHHIGILKQHLERDFTQVAGFELTDISASPGGPVGICSLVKFVSTWFVRQA